MPNPIWVLSGALGVALGAMILLWLRVRRLRRRVRALEHTAALIDSAPYYIAYDDGSDDAYANAAASRMVGQPEGQPMQKADTHDEEGIRILTEEAFPAVEKNGAWVGENRLRHTDGHMIDVQQFVFPVMDKAGRRLGMSTLMRDITDEKAMRRSFDIQLAILNSSASFIIALDLSFRIVYANPGAYALTGYSKDELGLNFTPEQFHTPETARRIRASWALALTTGTCEIETEFIRKGGQRVEVAHWIFAMRDERGATIGIGVILSDITVIKEMQRDLVAAKDAAEAANKAKSFFLSNMSHEIRTPMNAIVGMTKIAQMTDDPARVRDALTKVQISSEHLLNIINDVLDLSKIESGKLELYSTNFRIRACLDGVMGIIGVKMDEKRLHLSAHIAEDVPQTVYGDANRLAQVVMNLFSNAVKFTPEGGHISLSVSAKRLMSPKVRVDIAVKDDGVGMTPKQQGRLFKAFEQTDAGITSKYGGTGLGLAISKRLVQMMGGEFHVTSAPGQGSEFAFFVICEEAEEEGAQGALDEDCGEANFAGRCVLLAEDIEINREILRVLLEPTNIEIDEAVDGREAVRLFSEHPGRYGMVFMDLQMPNLDGFGATRAIRESGAAGAETIPIVAMTANAFAEDVARCIDAGMDDHISKPINIDQVLACMRHYLGDEGRRAGGRESKPQRSVLPTPRSSPVVLHHTRSS